MYLIKIYIVSQEQLYATYDIIVSALHQLLTGGFAPRVTRGSGRLRNFFGGCDTVPQKDTRNLSGTYEKLY